ncbi:ribonuclease III [Neisseria sp. ZJ106]|uniref:Ribonuclease 3 n=1 Tax=Neisseria lisongii TaxID=2912188 RepID=A0AAW5ANE0_9NEIS|nr:ribonuclease III [Neisseria lisongii]MCF7520690.1 ribonuclease III [Neisseria lisongii]MCF7529971.1 ribonuclease III [Neisseria lisongii]WCL72338.1 ribonuclease III [Neisseria lisongii]
MKSDLIKQQAHLAIQKRLDYTFRRPELLRQALTHRSFSAAHNERFEFIGDAILNYTVAKMLYDTFPKLTEGELSRLRANLVNEGVLAEIALEINVGDGLYLGSGELKSGGFRRPSILADAMEAMFAAVSFDADFFEAEKVVRRLFAERVKQVDFKNQGKDNKTTLQEALQARRLALPKYRIEDQICCNGEIQFVISCDLGELGFVCQAQGSSRKAAEQETAAEALAWLEKKFPLKKSRK